MKATGEDRARTGITHKEQRKWVRLDPNCGQSMFHSKNEHDFWNKPMASKEWRQKEKTATQSTNGTVTQRNMGDTTKHMRGELRKTKGKSLDVIRREFATESLQTRNAISAHVMEQRMTQKMSLWQTTLIENKPQTEITLEREIMNNTSNKYTPETAAVVCVCVCVCVCVAVGVLLSSCVSIAVDVVVSSEAAVLPSFCVFSFSSLSLRFCSRLALFFAFLASLFFTCSS